MLSKSACALLLIKLHKRYEHFVFFVTAQCGVLIGVTVETLNSCDFS
jgi:hypothetical protein